MNKLLKNLPIEIVDRIIEMAWEDRTPFDAIYSQFGVSERQTIDLMRNQLKPSSFRLWRTRVQGRKTKHLKKSDPKVGRFKSKMQRNISNNRISKR
ncbi:MAG: TIGR03643 family protein [Flavobacteriaceae bacterium]|nr:TIGR03643 family protein [Flavobacteriaceae bacterium]|tara:strand:+ start:5931 stop:6218 length:288 start_codon:yes stop_codon:yes gene_type:complete